MCVCLCVHEFHAACVKDRQQILGVVSLLQPQGTKGSNSGPQTWQKACLATQPSHPFLSSKAFPSFTEFQKQYEYLHVLKCTLIVFCQIIYSAASLGSQGVPHQHLVIQVPRLYVKKDQIK